MRKFTDELSNFVSNDNSSLTTGKNGYTLLQDTYQINKLAHFNRERVPERVVHAKGGGAYGYFECMKDMSKYTCADFLSRIGKRTEMFARFSTVGGEKGSSDTARDPRGFALKLYTTEGNYDIVGNNTPVFFIRDSIKFPDFIHTQKKDPKNNVKNYNMFWDFLSGNPESMHQTLILFSTRGIPKGFRHMHGFGTNTFMWYNEKKDYVWIKYHFKTNQGIENWTVEEAEKLDAINPDSSIEDLYNAIKNGNFPSWNVYVQIMTKEQAEKYHFNPFDATKVWYHKDYPLILIGRMTLNRNPENFFAETEQAAFSPSHFVNGVGPSPDKLLQGRLFAYPDAHRHRIGANANQLEINRPKNMPVNYQKDGDMTNIKFNTETKMNYYPNSYECVYTDPTKAPPKIEINGTMARYTEDITDVDFEQPRKLYEQVLNESERKYMVDSISNSLKRADLKLQYRMASLLYKTSVDLGMRVSDTLNLKIADVKSLANMTQEERMKMTSYANCTM